MEELVWSEFSSVAPDDDELLSPSKNSPLVDRPMEKRRSKERETGLRGGKGYGEVEKRRELQTEVARRRRREAKCNGEDTERAIRVMRLENCEEERGKVMKRRRTEE
uniref:Uncharacterized protein n=1 Tax=Pristionchus pacificus TaxID=54126 RepID=A0A2A6D0Z6_PRIPA|eukprot:PDM84152.1 hypothetical protein PRIPAC_34344 [Pristionchus pacificus]